MNLNLDKDDAIHFLEWRISYAEEMTKDNGRIPGNALNESDDGEICALKDARNIIEMSSEKSFPKLMRTTYKERVSQKKPHYDSSQDKANGDSWWITGYDGVMKMLGIKKR